MARKGQSFQKYTEELKREAVRLRLERENHCEKFVNNSV